MASLQYRVLAVGSLLLSFSSLVTAASKAVALYEDAQCATPPFSMQVLKANASTCTAQPCSPFVFGDETFYYNSSCVDEDAHAHIAAALRGTRHVVMEQFDQPNCSQDSYKQTHAMQDLRRCMPFAASSVSRAQNATILDDGSVNVVLFPATNCSTGSPTAVALGKDRIAQHACHVASKFFLSTSGDSSTSSSASSSGTAVVTPQSVASNNNGGLRGASIGGLCVAAVLILAAAGLVTWKWRSARKKRQFTRNTEPNDSVAMLEPDDTVFLSKPVSGPTFLPQSSSTCATFREQTTTRSFAPVLSSFGSSSRRSGRTFVPGSSTGSAFPGATTTMTRPWEDEVVLAARIPRDKVVVVQFLSRGGFGVVYSGLYSGRRVAVKMLLPETRRSISHVGDLLAEVKMMAAMEHPHIVEFIGVAWDALTNMCIVSEFMAGGDLKVLLSDYEEQGFPVGFNREKLKIALHIAHALTYMHSLDPPIIHRDLKSKNVLLSERLDAKLTDFGTSRERVNESMTGGVGTCLWMAPEVMVGEKYDDKADMFSFGVVLSELDTHVSPYWHAKDPNDSTRQMPEPAILQLVATGKLHVKFSKGAIAAVVALGNSCLSLHPTARPTASEALYSLHTIWADDVERTGVMV